MSLADAVHDASSEPLVVPRPMVSPPKVARAAADAEARMERVGVFTPVDLVVLRSRLSQGQELRTLGSRDFKHVANLLWDPPPLAADTNFLTRYVAEIAEGRSPSALRRLALFWLLRFSAGAPGIQETAAILRREASCLRGALADPQIARRVFDPLSGPVALAEQLATSNETPAEILQRHGIKGAAAEAGFVLAAFEALLARLGITMAAARGPYLPLLHRVLEFARDAKGNPRFDQARAAMAEALLRPFGAADPSREVRELIEGEILARLGDPRVAAARWAGVSEGAKEVMLRWLAEATLEAFLSIVQRYAEPDHWRFREAFWRAYLRAGHIRSVQVAFRSQAAREARQLGRKDSRLLAFAELDGSGTLANHAVLLLRIGDLVLAEWSHNGALRIWRAGNRLAPRLTARHFSGSDLKAEADLRIVHYPQAQWQAKVADFVWRETGLRVQSSDYMPRR